MITLIAESKTMRGCDGNVAPETYEACRPLTERQADALFEGWRGLTAAGISAAVKVSPTLGRAMHDMIYDFPNKACGGRAVEAFTGVVFRALDYASLPPEAASRIDRDVRIISSAYGWLRPGDIIKPYRLDFTTRLAPGGLAMARWWRPEVTRLLEAEIEAGGHGDVLDLMPADAARAVDFKRISAKARVWKAVFRSVGEGGVERTPDAGRLKALRGQLLRYIAENAIDDPALLAGVETPAFVCERADATTGELRLLTC